MEWQKCTLYRPNGDFLSLLKVVQMLYLLQDQRDCEKKIPFRNKRPGNLFYDGSKGFRLLNGQYQNGAMKILNKCVMIVEITKLSKLNTNKNLAGNIQEAKTRFPSVVGQRPASHRMGENTYVSFQTTLLSVLHSPPPHNENIIVFLPFCFLCLPFWPKSVFRK